jgi:hypothetical protein
MRNIEPVKVNIHTFRKVLPAFAAAVILNFVAVPTEIL